MNKALSTRCDFDVCVEVVYDLNRNHKHCLHDVIYRDSRRVGARSTNSPVGLGLDGLEALASDGRK